MESEDMDIDDRPDTSLLSPTHWNRRKRLADPEDPDASANPDTEEEGATLAPSLGYIQVDPAKRRKIEQSSSNVAREGGATTIQPNSEKSSITSRFSPNRLAGQFLSGNSGIPLHSGLVPQATSGGSKNADESSRTGLSSLASAEGTPLFRIELSILLMAMMSASTLNPHPECETRREGSCRGFGDFTFACALSSESSYMGEEESPPLPTRVPVQEASQNDPGIVPRPLAVDLPINDAPDVGLQGRSSPKLSPLSNMADGAIVFPSSGASITQSLQRLSLQSVIDTLPSHDVEMRDAVYRRVTNAVIAEDWRREIQAQASQGDMNRLSKETAGGDGDEGMPKHPSIGSLDAVTPDDSGHPDIGCEASLIPSFKSSPQHESQAIVYGGKAATPLLTVEIPSPTLSDNPADRKLCPQSHQQTSPASLSQTVAPSQLTDDICSRRSGYDSPTAHAEEPTASGLHIDPSNSQLSTPTGLFVDEAPLVRIERPATQEEAMVDLWFQRSTAGLARQGGDRQENREPFLQDRPDPPTESTAIGRKGFDWGESHSDGVEGVSQVALDQITEPKTNPLRQHEQRGKDGETVLTCGDLLYGFQKAVRPAAELDADPWTPCGEICAPRTIRLAGQEESSRNAMLAWNLPVQVQQHAVDKDWETRLVVVGEGDDQTPAFDAFEGLHMMHPQGEGVSASRVDRRPAQQEAPTHVVDFTAQPPLDLAGFFDWVQIVPDVEMGRDVPAPSTKRLGAQDEQTQIPSLGWDDDHGASQQGGGMELEIPPGGAKNGQNSSSDVLDALQMVHSPYIDASVPPPHRRPVHENAPTCVVDLTPQPYPDPTGIPDSIRATLSIEIDRDASAPSTKRSSAQEEPSHVPVFRWTDDDDFKTELQAITMDWEMPTGDEKVAQSLAFNAFEELQEVHPQCEDMSVTQVDKRSAQQEASTHIVDFASRSPVDPVGLFDGVQTVPDIEMGLDVAAPGMKRLGVQEELTQIHTLRWDGDLGTGQREADTDQGMPNGDVEKKTRSPEFDATGRFDTVHPQCEDVLATRVDRQPAQQEAPTHFVDFASLSSVDPAGLFDGVQIVPDAEMGLDVVAPGTKQLSAQEEPSQTPMFRWNIGLGEGHQAVDADWEMRHAEETQSSGFDAMKGFRMFHPQCEDVSVTRADKRPPQQEAPTQIVDFTSVPLSDPAGFPDMVQIVPNTEMGQDVPASAKKRSGGQEEPGQVPAPLWRTNPANKDDRLLLPPRLKDFRVPGLGVSMIAEDEDEEDILRTMVTRSKRRKAKPSSSIGPSSRRVFTRPTNPEISFNYSKNTQFYAYGGDDDDLIDLSDGSGSERGGHANRNLSPLPHPAQTGNGYSWDTWQRQSRERSDRASGSRRDNQRHLKATPHFRRGGKIFILRPSTHRPSKRSIAKRKRDPVSVCDDDLPPFALPAELPVDNEVDNEEVVLGFTNHTIDALIYVEKGAPPDECAAKLPDVQLSLEQGRGVEEPPIVIHRPEEFVVGDETQPQGEIPPRDGMLPEKVASDAELRAVLGSMAGSTAPLTQNHGALILQKIAQLQEQTARAGSSRPATSDTPSATPSRRKGKEKEKLPDYGVHPRDKTETAMRGVLRKFVFEKMGRKEHPTGGLAPISSVCGQDAWRWAAFRSSSQPGDGVHPDQPGPLMFYLDHYELDGKSRTVKDKIRNAGRAWNAHQVERLSAEFKEMYPRYQEQDVKGSLLTHLETLIDQRKRFVNAEDRTLYNRIQAEKQRRMRRHHRRLELVDAFDDTTPEMPPFQHILRHQFPWQGCSGDESDTVDVGKGQPVRRLVITHLDWSVSGPQTINGTLGRARIDPEDYPNVEARLEQRSNKWVPGLPKNFYSEEWLDKIPEWERKAVMKKATPAVSLEFCQDLKQAAVIAKGMMNGEVGNVLTQMSTVGRMFEVRFQVNGPRPAVAELIPAPPRPFKVTNTGLASKLFGVPPLLGGLKLCPDPSHTHCKGETGCFIRHQIQWDVVLHPGEHLSSAKLYTQLPRYPGGFDFMRGLRVNSKRVKSAELTECGGDNPNGSLTITTVHIRVLARFGSFEVLDGPCREFESEKSEEETKQHLPFGGKLFRMGHSHAYLNSQERETNDEQEPREVPSKSEKADYYQELRDPPSEEADLRESCEQNEQERVHHSEGSLRSIATQNMSSIVKRHSCLHFGSASIVEYCHW
ncbi:hypothetical protein FA13DRAFT_1714683 [Coprinellus micaceus]|uniref:Uncharacterized protein n=1 Tax=Coprinellus micaceus TaxID=71717 RepID=A0A4Y7SRW2_COPMI|nr:hypothetical protein FA13DRAFT_1714683 [Coprinellus micaceus]